MSQFDSPTPRPRDEDQSIDDFGVSSVERFDARLSDETGVSQFF